MGELAVMDGTGDEKLTWDPKNEIATQKAKDRFSDLKRKGYKAYRVNHAGGKGEEIHDFDPYAYEIVMHKIAVGG